MTNQPENRTSVFAMSSETPNDSSRRWTCCQVAAKVASTVGHNRKNSHSTIRSLWSALSHKFNCTMIISCKWVNDLQTPVNVFIWNKKLTTMNDNTRMLRINENAEKITEVGWVAYKEKQDQTYPNKIVFPPSTVQYNIIAKYNTTCLLQKEKFAAKG